MAGIRSVVKGPPRRSEVQALKQESRILGQWSNPISGSRKSQARMGQTAQCSIMEKPHTGLYECPRIRLSCFRARNSVPDCRPRMPILSVFLCVTFKKALYFGVHLETKKFQQLLTPRGRLIGYIFITSHSEIRLKFGKFFPLKCCY